MKEKILEFISKMETPMLANYELLCTSCDEDMGLEAYDCFDEGYNQAIEDLKKEIVNNY